MSKRILVALVVLALSAQFVAADTGNTNPNDIVGVFNYNTDVGNPTGYGFTMDLGVGMEPGLGDSREYLLTGAGDDIWGTWDQFHIAYNLVSGDVRMSADFDRVSYYDYWTKYGLMIRDPGADGDAVHYMTQGRKDEDAITFQGRDGTGWGAYDTGWGGGSTANATFGIQRITSGGITVVQGLIDYNTGGGWQVINQKVNPNLPDEIMVGAAITAHTGGGGLAQTKVYNVAYETEDIGLIGITTVSSGAGAEACSDVPGFKIRVKKRNFDVSPDWNYNEAIRLLNGEVAGDVLDWDLIGSPGWNPTEGVRIDPVVNLNQDDSDSGAFGDDSHFPGIDLLKAKGAYADDNDDDNDFATEVVACIYLTQGLHILGANSDDGTIITIGGTEIGRTGEWKGASNVDFLFDVAEEGWYSFLAQNLEGGGGASLELHEVLGDGTRILLGAMDDQGAFIGSPVYAPEPATIALLGLGGLSLLRRKRS